MDYWRSSLKNNRVNKFIYWIYFKVLIQLMVLKSKKRKLWNLLIDNNYRYLLLYNIKILKIKSIKKGQSHICPIHTRVINNHIIQHNYTPEYTCSEENTVTNVDPGCCNKF